MFWPRAVSCGGAAAAGVPRRRLKATGEGLEIQAAAAHQQRHAPLLQSGVDAGVAIATELLEGDRLIGRAQVEQMVRHPRLLLRGRLGGSDVHLPDRAGRESTLITGRSSRSAMSSARAVAAGGGPEQGDHQGWELLKGEGSSPAWNGR